MFILLSRCFGRTEEGERDRRYLSGCPLFRECCGREESADCTLELKTIPVGAILQCYRGIQSTNHCLLRDAHLFNERVADADRLFGGQR
jgi:hypothetical protein